MNITRKGGGSIKRFVKRATSSTDNTISNTEIRADKKLNETKKIKMSGDNMKKILDMIYPMTHYKDKYNTPNKISKEIDSALSQSHLAAEDARVKAEIARLNAETARVYAIKKKKDLLKSLIRKKYYAYKKSVDPPKDKDDFKVFNSKDPAIQNLTAAQSIALLDKAFDLFERQSKELLKGKVERQPKSFEEILKDIIERISEIDKDKVSSPNINESTNDVLSQINNSEDKNELNEIKKIDAIIPSDKADTALLKKLSAFIETHNRKSTNEYINNKREVYKFLLNTLEVVLFSYQANTFINSILPGSDEKIKDSLIHKAIIQKYICQSLYSIIKNDNTAINKLFKSRISTSYTLVEKYPLLKKFDINSIKTLLDNLDKVILSRRSNYRISDISLTIEPNMKEREKNEIFAKKSIYLPDEDTIDDTYLQIMFPSLNKDRKAIDPVFSRSELWRKVIDKIYQVEEERDRDELPESKIAEAKKQSNIIKEKALEKHAKIKNFANKNAAAIQALKKEKEAKEKAPEEAAKKEKARKAAQEAAEKAAKEKEAAEKAAKEKEALEKASKEKEALEKAAKEKEAAEKAAKEKEAAEKAAKEEAARKAAEEEAIRKAAEEEATRKATQEEAARKATQEEARKASEEAARKASEEAARIAKEKEANARAKKQITDAKMAEFKKMAESQKKKKAKEEEEQEKKKANARAKEEEQKNLYNQTKRYQTQAEENKEAMAELESLKVNEVPEELPENAGDKKGSKVKPPKPEPKIAQKVAEAKAALTSRVSEEEKKPATANVAASAEVPKPPRPPPRLPRSAKKTAEANTVPTPEKVELPKPPTPKLKVSQSEQELARNSNEQAARKSTAKQIAIEAAAKSKEMQKNRGRNKRHENKTAKAKTIGLNLNKSNKVRGSNKEQKANNGQQPLQEGNPNSSRMKARRNNQLKSEKNRENRERERSTNPKRPSKREESMPPGNNKLSPSKPLKWFDTRADPTRGEEAAKTRIGEVARRIGRGTRGLVGIRKKPQLSEPGTRIGGSRKKRKRRSRHVKR